MIHIVTHAKIMPRRGPTLVSSTRLFPSQPKGHGFRNVVIGLAAASVAAVGGIAGSRALVRNQANAIRPLAAEYVGIGVNPGLAYIGVRFSPDAAKALQEIAAKTFKTPASKLTPDHFWRVFKVFGQSYAGGKTEVPRDTAHATTIVGGTVGSRKRILSRIKPGNAQRILRAWIALNEIDAPSRFEILREARLASKRPSNVLTPGIRLIQRWVPPKQFSVPSNTRRVNRSIPFG